mgnify:CR=1 FL=1
MVAVWRKKVLNTVMVSERSFEPSHQKSVDVGSDNFSAMIDPLLAEIVPLFDEIGSKDEDLLIVMQICADTYFKEIFRDAPRITMTRGARYFYRNPHKSGRCIGAMIPSGTIVSGQACRIELATLSEQDKRSKVLALVLDHLEQQSGNPHEDAIANDMLNGKQIMHVLSLPHSE